MNIDLLRSLATVLAEGSLNKAAVRLGMAQSSLTRQMQALEHEIGGRLLERTSSGVAATAAGQALAARLDEVLGALDDALAEARRLARGQQSILRVGYLLSAARTYLNPALAEMRRAHPEVKVKLFDLSPGEQIDGLRRGEIDVGLIGQSGKVLESEFYSKRLALLPLVVALSETHPLAAREKLRLADLKGENFVGAPEYHVPGNDRWIAQLCRRAGFRPRFAQESDSLMHGLSLVVSEGAVAVLPEFAVDMQAPGIVMRPLGDAFAKFEFLVVWQRGKVTAPTRALIDALAAVSGK
ncbi:LysR family transcriptional regulator [Opitutales bacterium ASA1]|uniref:LysR family transcriptional regulator n=1 Tax=Congregicoccus parvus TaxID=3081749 RepID=UPI002B2D1AB0|nr:LysR family transcriptional regulator [Opitutales bacterium ASA1]